MSDILIVIGCVEAHVVLIGIAMPRLIAGKSDAVDNSHISTLLD